MRTSNVNINSTRSFGKTGATAKGIKAPVVSGKATKWLAKTASKITFSPSNLARLIAYQELIVKYSFDPKSATITQEVVNGEPVFGSHDAAYALAQTILAGKMLKAAN